MIDDENNELEDEVNSSAPEDDINPQEFPEADDMKAEADGPPPIYAPLTGDPEMLRHQLKAMYRGWYLEYASYVILERAVPLIDDGLKPVQRRILHSMRTMHDGRYNKVANIVGNTMQYHPHGDASIKDALVQLGQKELLIDTQGNWGNILTGNSAAAGRYIEARLSQMALDILFDPKVTNWTVSYDGRKREPVTLPVRFPLLLAQGAEGIAVGLSSKILPHNPSELVDAAIAYLRGEPFELLPDFPTGGLMDVSHYNDGRRGGMLKVRAKIEKVDNKTLSITEIPFGKTSVGLRDSIAKASEKGQIKIKHVEDYTSSTANITVTLQPGVSSDKTIDALYAFTDCEVSIAPNCCVIKDRKPVFIGVSDLLRHSVDATRDILRRQLEIQINETRERLFFASLERIFIEKHIYKDKEYEQAPDLEAAIAHVTMKLEKYVKKPWRDITRDDVLKLFEIKMKRILRFNATEADELMVTLQARIEEIQERLNHLTEFTIEWYQQLRSKYGQDWQRRTEIRNFDAIAAARVVEATERLYINRAEGFIGTSLKKDELVGPCSPLDDVLLIYRDGKYKVVRVAEKLSVGKGVKHISVFKRGDERTIYNVIYQDGRQGAYYIKRFSISGLTRDKEYDITRGKPGSHIAYMTVNANGEAEKVRVILKPKARLKSLVLDLDFADIAIKNRSAVGNLVTRNDVHRFTMKAAGASTLGGRKVWWDNDVRRLNYEGRGELLGEFEAQDCVLVITKNGEFYTTTFEDTNHYQDDILRIEQFEPDKVWTAVLYDAEQGGKPYLKRFTLEPSTRHQRWLTDNEASQLILLTDTVGARIHITYGGEDAWREAQDIVVADFVGVKSFRAKGKRLTSYTLGEVKEIEPVIEADDEVLPDEDESPEEPQVELDPDATKTPDQIRDELTGQGRLFDDDNA